MIGEVDAALRALIQNEAVVGSDVEVVFDAPTKDWAGRRNVPTIDVYLYDIREDLRRRERGLINEIGEGGRVVARHLPPRHFKLSYLITAWTQRPEDEHRLLSALLACFLRHDALPAELLEGPLAELGKPVPMTVALPPPEDRSFADVWSALGGELKPSLDVVVSAPTDTGQRYEAGPPVEAPPRIAVGGTAGWPPQEHRAGRVPVAVPTAADAPAAVPPGRPWTDAFLHPVDPASEGTPTTDPDPASGGEGGAAPAAPGGEAAVPGAGGAGTAGAKGAQATGSKRKRSRLQGKDP